MRPLEPLVIRPDLLRDISAVDEFKGRWVALQNLAPERLAALRRAATIESVGSSTRIEGATLTDDEVVRLLAGLDVRSIGSRDEQEVKGYATLMETVFTSWREISLTENHIQHLHAIMLASVEKDARHRGLYKTLPNSIEAFDEEGRSVGTIFSTASPFDTPRLMEQLVHWTKSALETGEHHPLLIFGAFIVRFLAIHPFQDGNGRLSRALTTLLLLRAGYEYAPYASLERVVEDNKNEYYRALRAAQSTLDEGESDLIDWISFFVRCLVKQTEVLSARIDRERLMRPLAPLSEQLLAIVREHGRLTVREATGATGANRNTIKEHLKRLVQSGQLVRHGRGRGSFYTKV